ncbi:Type IIS restriction enzyme [metagenome]|uniref:site-specific DNA-methyltransferase (adenine-specific) n=1 Tax=metagenome TaxID=256318 RepID=A0A2P2C7W2_9ZZZZ
METAPLKNFATWARTALIREVTARIAAVLAPGSSERVEQTKAVVALEKAVNAAGGGDKGRAVVADKVAYTWFNRIIALRFMEANGYTGIGVVSPQSGVEVGQPEILAEAKRGVIDTEVVSQLTRTAVAGLLDGTRASGDPQGEAYALLLADYCRYWNRAMPFMFEREGDFTELLIPANLLADDSVLNRSVKVLTEDVCKDVEVIGWLYQFYISERKDEVFAGFKKNKKAGADEIPAATQLFTPHWIVRYLVENSLGRLWMLNRPGSGLVSQMDYYIAPVDEETDFLKITKPEELKVIDPACGSGHLLTYAFDLLYAIYEEEGYGPVEIPGLILTHNLYGTEIDPRAGALAAFALTMKARAEQRTFFTKQVKPNICVIDPLSFGPQELDFLVTKSGDRQAEAAFWNQFAEADSVGALIQPNAALTAVLARHVATLNGSGDLLTADVIEWAERCLTQAEYLSDAYAVVITNPPYMGSGNMDASVSAWVKDQFPNEKQDLYGCFVTRCSRLASDRGLVALVIGDTWMTIKSFEKFRKDLLSRCTFETFVHMRDVSNHPDIFGANAAFVFSNNPTHHQTCTFVFLDPSSEEGKRRRLVEAVRDPDVAWSYRIEPEQFDAIPGAPITFRLSGPMRRAFTTGRPLGLVSQPRNGLSTSNNDRFLRMWWEVSGDRTIFGCRNLETAAQSSGRWFPLNKGGDFRRWYGNQSHVVNWENNGKEVKDFIVSRYPYLNGNPGIKVRSTESYFLPQVSWSSVSSGTPAFREYPIGLIFDGAAKSLFPESERERRELLGILNSEAITRLLSAIAPTLNFEVGQIAQLPVVGNLEAGASENVGRLVDASRLDWEDFETSWDFSSPSWLRRSTGEMALLHERLAEWSAWQVKSALEQQARETKNNWLIADAYSLQGEVPIDVPLHRVSLTRNVEFRYGAGKTLAQYAALERADFAVELISYAVGCMFGRYSLDKPGLVLADQRATLEDYLAKVPTPTFAPDSDNVIPIVGGDWFEDDIVERLRKFLRAAFGDQHFEENLLFVTESLGVKSLRDYFVKSFYKDHVQRYKKRPIYWLFSSPKGSFNALIYMHRYAPSTASTVLNEYLREFQAKLKASLEHAERSNSAKEADRLRKILLELDEYEHEVLYPLASQNIAIDLDDGVKTNYPKLGAALKQIPGLEASE